MIGLRGVLVYAPLDPSAPIADSRGLFGAIVAHWGLFGSLGLEVSRLEGAAPNPTRRLMKLPITGLRILLKRNICNYRKGFESYLSKCV